MEPARRSRGRRPDPAKRVAIVEAACDLFARHGYGVSMEAIAAEAGVSKQTIYNLHSTKERLFGAVVAARSEMIVAAIPTPDDTLAAAEGLARIAREFLRFMIGGQVPLVYRLMLATPDDAGADLTREFYDNGPRRSLGQLAAFLARCDSAGSLKVPDPALAGECFFGMLNGQILIRNMLGLQRAWASEELDAKARYCVETFLARHGV